MSWFSRAFSTVTSVVKSAVAVVAKVALPIVSSFVGAIPVIGGIAAKITDSLGNKLIEGFDGAPPEIAAQQSVNTYVEAAAANNKNATLSKPEVDFSDAQQASFMGMGGNDAEQAASTPASVAARGFLGIGDGKPGVLGIGTGKHKARKAAEAAARARGLSESEIKAAGELAANNVSETGNPNGTPAAGGGSMGIVALIAAAAALLLL